MNMLKNLKEDMDKSINAIYRNINSENKITSVQDMKA